MNKILDKDDFLAMHELDINKSTPILSGNGEEEGDFALAEKTKVKRPPRYKVLLHNDDYTTMEFVVYVLERIFGKTKEEAYAVMLLVHNEGRGVCGIYTYEVAETKMKKVSLEAKKNGHPLLCTIEPE